MVHLVGSDGPTILLFGLEPTGANSLPLQEAFRKLTRDTKSLRLDEQDFVIPMGGIQVLAKSVERARPRLRRTARNALRFEWTLSPEDWDERAEFIDGLVRSPRRGHQYLTDRASDDAIVVVSHGEYSDQLLLQLRLP